VQAYTPANQICVSVTVGDRCDQLFWLWATKRIKWMFCLRSVRVRIELRRVEQRLKIRRTERAREDEQEIRAA
jgi:hypothetical protein